MTFEVSAIIYHCQDKPPLLCTARTVQEKHRREHDMHRMLDTKPPCRSDSKSQPTDGMEAADLGRIDNLKRPDKHRV